MQPRQTLSLQWLLLWVPPLIVAWWLCPLFQKTAREFETASPWWFFAVWKQARWLTPVLMIATTRLLVLRFSKARLMAGLLLAMIATMLPMLLGQYQWAECLDRLR